MSKYLSRHRQKRNWAIIAAFILRPCLYTHYIKIQCDDDSISPVSWNHSRAPDWWTADGVQYLHDRLHISKVLQGCHPLRVHDHSLVSWLRSEFHQASVHQHLSECHHPCCQLLPQVQELEHWAGDWVHPGNAHTNELRLLVWSAERNTLLSQKRTKHLAEVRHQPNTGQSLVKFGLMWSLWDPFYKKHTGSCRVESGRGAAPLQKFLYETLLCKWYGCLAQQYSKDSVTVTL